MASNRFLLALAALLALPHPGAGAEDGRRALQVPAARAAERVEQLSPGSGVVPGYRRDSARGYPSDPVVFEGNLPVGVQTRDGGAMRPFRPATTAPKRGGFFQLFGSRSGRARIPNGAGGAGDAAPRHAFLAGEARGARRDVPPGAVSRALDPAFLPQTVAYSGGEAPGTIVIDTVARFLYHVEANGTARRYGVGVGKPGFGWAGAHRVTRKAEWPGWTPPSQMIARERAKGRILPAHMPGGPENPLGARAMYLGSTLYRIHGTNQPWTIGQQVSSGCIRMRNEDVMELYERVAVGTRVIVL